MSYSGREQVSANFDEFQLPVTRRTSKLLETRSEDYQEMHEDAVLC